MTTRAQLGANGVLTAVQISLTTGPLLFELG